MRPAARTLGVGVRSGAGLILVPCSDERRFNDFWRSRLSPHAFARREVVGLFSSAAFATRASVPAISGAGAIDIRAHGARGDDRSDDWSAIHAAQATARARGVGLYFPPGRYRISRTLDFAVPWIGSGGDVSVVLPHEGGFKGQMLVDLRDRREGKYMVDIGLDADLRSGVTLLASSRDATGSARATFERITFAGTRGGLYAVGGESSRPGPGMLTGSSFIHCLWSNCAQPLRVGENQDDVLLVGSRFSQLPSNRPRAAPIVLHGQNVQMISTYFYFVEAVSVTPVALMEIGAYPVSVNGLFLEADDRANAAYVFAQSFPLICLSVESVRLGVATLRSLSAFIQVLLANDAQSATSFVELARVQPMGDSSRVALLSARLEGDRGPTELTAAFQGCDGFGRVLDMTGSSGARPTVVLTGVHRGVAYSSRAFLDQYTVRFKPLEAAK